MNKKYQIEFDNESYILQMAETADPHELENCLRSFQFFQKLCCVGA